VPVLAELAWPILERIQLFGDLAVSPHGISIAAGFLLGAQLLLHRAQRRGVARRHVEGIPEIIQALVTRAAIGAILGARFFYVVTRLDAYPDPLAWFRVWEGGLSLLGGITGAVLAGVPYALRRKLSIPLILDSVAPGLALGIFVGRIGDLVIGEHLGGRTDFVLGWRCTGNIGVGPPQPWPGPTVQGCFDATVHQTALYDFLAGGAVLLALLLLERRPRFDGFSMAAFAVLYGAGRFVSDFARAADRDMVGTLTGSQLAALVAVAAVLAWVAAARPQRRTPYAWSPPDFAHPWDPQAEGDHAPAGPPSQPPTTEEIH
jgi:phosphatidylglycerol:prolipoprotein diacylglycerol transferase